MKQIFLSIFTLFFVIPVSAAWDVSNYANVTTIEIDVSTLGLASDVSDYPLLVRVTGTALDNFFEAKKLNVCINLPYLIIK